MKMKTHKTINVEDMLWSRYDECYQCAKTVQDAASMIDATDRMAALMGVTFNIPDEEEDE